MKMALGENPKNVYHEKNQAPSTRMATAALIRDQLMKARRYEEAVLRADGDPDVDPPEYNTRSSVCCRCCAARSRCISTPTVQTIFSPPCALRPNSAWIM